MYTLDGYFVAGNHKSVEALREETKAIEDTCFDGEKIFNWDFYEDDHTIEVNAESEMKEILYSDIIGNKTLLNEIDEGTMALYEDGFRIASFVYSDFTGRREWEISREKGERTITLNMAEWAVIKDMLLDIPDEEMDDVMQNLLNKFEN